MKKNLVFVLFFTASIIFGQTNPTVVVSPFSARGQAVSTDDAESITELFIAELAKTGGLRVVDRTSLDRVVAEMRFQTSDWSNPQKTARLGAALNAEILVRGQLNQLGQQITITITALDIKTLEIVAPSTDTFSTETIFQAKDYWGHTNYSSIFYKMPSMANNISSLIKTKMAVQEQQRQFAGITGTWQATGNNYAHTETNVSGPNQLLITFNNDGTFTYTMNECFTATISTPSGGMFPNITNFVLKFQTEGNGSYEFDGNNKIKFRGNYHTNGIQIRRGSTSWESLNTYSVNDVINFSVTVEITSNGQIMQWKERPEMSGSYDHNKQIPIPTMFQKVSSK